MVFHLNDNQWEQFTWSDSRDTQVYGEVWPKTKPKPAWSNWEKKPCLFWGSFVNIYFLLTVIALNILPYLHYNIFIVIMIKLQFFSFKLPRSVSLYRFTGANFIQSLVRFKKQSKQKTSNSQILLIGKYVLSTC